MHEDEPSRWLRYDSVQALASNPSTFKSERDLNHRVQGWPPQGDSARSVPGSNPFCFSCEKIIPTAALEGNERLGFAVGGGCGLSCGSETTLKNSSIRVAKRMDHAWFSHPWGAGKLNTIDISQWRRGVDYAFLRSHYSVVYLIYPLKFAFMFKEATIVDQHCCCYIAA